jgi:hypothetical protein
VGGVRNIGGCCLIVWLGLAGAAVAEPKPEDPYPDVVDPKVEPKTAPTPTMAKATPVSEPTEQLAWWEDGEWYEDNAWIGFVVGLVALIWIGRRRNIAKQRRAVLDARRTQFQMSAIDPAVAEHHATVWERGPQIVPTAIEQAAMVSPRRRRLADGTAQPPIVNPEPLVHPRPLPATPSATPRQHPAALQPPPTPWPAPAPYPLTFPAFPEPANVVMLAPIEPSGVSRWPATPEPDYVIPFARGSAPDDQLEPIRCMILPADAQTQIMTDRRTLVSHGVPRRRY